MSVSAFQTMARIREWHDSHFRQNVGDVGLVEGGEGKALLAEVVERSTYVYER